MTSSPPRNHNFDRRRFPRRSFLAGAVLGATALGAAAACSKSDAGEVGSADTLKRILEEGTVRVGFANEAPYGFQDSSGNLVGEAPAVSKEIFTRMGVPKIEGKLVEFASLIPALQARKVDIIAAGMFITPERCSEITFSEPDYCARSAFIVPKGNSRSIKTYDDVAKSGIRLGVMSGAVEVGYAKAAGVTNTVTFTDPPAGFDGLAAGRADALALTSVSLRYLLKNRPNSGFELTEPFIPMLDGVPQEGCGGYGFRRADADLITDFNKHLAELKASGELLKLIGPYGFTETEISGDQTAKTLCTAS